MKQRLSVVIPARNEADHLGSCLDALGRQTYPREFFETIVVDNGSTDATQRVASDRGCHVLTSHASTVAGARNLGAAVATGSFLAFLDADCIPAPDWLECGLRSLLAERCITGADVLPPSDAGWVARNWTFLLRGRRNVPCINTGNLFVPVEVFRAVGGFDEKLQTGEDCEFCQRVSGSASVVSDSSIRVVHLGVPRSLVEFFRREMWHGLGALGTARTNCRDKPLIGTIAFALMSVMQLVAAIGGYAVAFAAATIGLLALCTAAVAFRRESIRGVGHSLALVLLHYVYFLARSVSLALLLLPRRFRPYAIRRRGGRVSHRSTTEA